MTTRTQDRDFWTLSEPSDANGDYTSLFTASESGNLNTKVPFAVQVAQGKSSYAFPFGVNVVFDRLHSATMDVTLGHPACRSRTCRSRRRSRVRCTRAR